jgi:hypothetical protein
MFVKGQSGNPRGPKPKAIKEQESLASLRLSLPSDDSIDYIELYGNSGGTNSFIARVNLPEAQ